MHLSPTMETNFVFGNLWASTRMCSKVRSLRGMLRPRQHPKYQQSYAVDCGTAHSPVLVQETHHPCAMPRWPALLLDLASLGDLPRIVVPSDRVHPPKARLCSPPLLLEALPPELLDHPLGLIVVDVLGKVTQLRVAQVVELLG